MCTRQSLIIVVLVKLIKLLTDSLKRPLYLLVHIENWSCACMQKCVSDFSSLSHSILTYDCHQLFVLHFIYIAMAFYVGCRINEQGSKCPDSKLPKLARTTYLSASQCDHACKTCFALLASGSEYSFRSWRHILFLNFRQMLRRMKFMHKWPCSH